MQSTKRIMLLAFPALMLVLMACAGIRGAEGGSSVAFNGDDSLFVGTRQGEVRALNPQTGRTKWKFELTGPDEDLRTVYGEPVVVGDTVFVGGYDFFLYALSTADGTLKSSELIGSRIVASPAVGGSGAAANTLVVGDTVGNVFGYDVSDPTTLIRKWGISVGGRVWSTPVIDGGAVYFGSLDHNFYALNIDDGTERWKFVTDGAIAAPPLIRDGRIYFGSFDKNFYALDEQTGREVWRFEGAKNWYWAKAITDGIMIYAPSLDNNLYALDISTGELKWKLKTEGPIAGSPAIVGNDKIAVPSDDGRLRIARLVDGTGLSECNIGDELRTPIMAKGDTIYFGVRADSSVRALRIKSDGNPDEVWVHFSDRDDPIRTDRSPDC